MFHIDITIEDSRLIADLDVVNSPNEYSCTTHDNLTGQSAPFWATPEQLSTIIRIMILGEDYEGYARDRDLVTHLFSSMPQELCLIP